ncbi:chemotaxis protein CheW [Luteimonas aquatica]|uniref:chemotaxis protein CheW n=1 Tax=Luteimonas aquatica TaxID=450364 RepID=UPI001F56B496|nr:chemotaxis protein CheW [Luteimonas aquatica]
MNASVQTSQDIRGVLIQVEGARLLLPNASISEVLSYATPEPVEDAPQWLLGRIRWRGWQLPLVSFSRIAGLAQEQGGMSNKVAVLKAFGGNPRLPHFAFLTQGFPRLVTVARQTLIPETEAADLSAGVLARVRLGDEAALIPDIDHVEDALRTALAL